MLIPSLIINILSQFAHLFSAPAFKKLQILCTGALLCPGKRTVSAILRIMSLAENKRFEKFHRFLNRDQWNLLSIARILLLALIKFVPDGAVIEVVSDETLERRFGDKIKAKGCYRDAVRSTKNHVVKCFGLKWLVFAVIVRLPVLKKIFALPFMTILLYSEKHDKALGKEHQTSMDRAIKAVGIISKWLKRPWRLIGDGGFACLDLVEACHQNGVTLISRLRLDARLFDVPAKSESKTKNRGRPALKGKRIPTFKQMLADTKLKWKRITVKWYKDEDKEIDVLTGVNLLYKAGKAPFPIRWVLIRDPTGKCLSVPLFSSNLDLDPQTIIESFVKRFSIEITFEEARAHLGFETQRQWSDKAIARSTPLIMGLFSLTCILAADLMTSTTLTVRSSAWYSKPSDCATFSDLIAFVRRYIWQSRILVNSPENSEMTKFKPDFLEPLLEILTYAA